MVKRLIIIFCTFLLALLVKAQNNFPLNNDNLIYEIGNEWVYEYEYIPHNKKDLENIQLMNEGVQRIDKIVMKMISFDCITKFKLDKNEVYEFFTDRLLQNSYPPEIMKDGAMVIENNEKVWIHPPRDFFFKILELNPFPYILKPYIVGKEWDWDLKIGRRWGDKRWKEWEGGITNKSHYKISGDTILDTKAGKLYCYIIDSYAINEIGKTYLTSYFNPKYGFIKLDYTNIDGSKIILNIIKIPTAAEKLFFRVGTN